MTSKKSSAAQKTATKPAPRPSAKAVKASGTPSRAARPAAPAAKKVEKTEKAPAKAAKAPVKPAPRPAAKAEKATKPAPAPRKAEKSAKAPVEKPAKAAEKAPAAKAEKATKPSRAAAPAKPAAAEKADKAVKAPAEKPEKAEKKVAAKAEKPEKADKAAAKAEKPAKGAKPAAEGAKADDAEAADGKAAKAKPSAKAKPPPKPKAPPKPLIPEIVRPVLTFQCSAGQKTATVLLTTPQSGRPTLFFHYDELLNHGEVGANWSHVGRALHLKPMTPSFGLLSWHENGSLKSSLRLGVRFTNPTPKPMVLELGQQDAKPQPALPMPQGAEKTPHGWRWSVPPMGSSVIPMASVVAAAAAGKGEPPRTQTISWRMEVRVVGGDAAQLAIDEVACHPEGGVKQAALVQPEDGSGKQHEGIYRPQAMQGGPVSLGLENALRFKTAGAAASHDIHFGVPHAFHFTLPQELVLKRPTLVFRHRQATRPHLGTARERIVLGSKQRLEDGTHELSLPLEEAVKAGHLRDSGKVTEEGLRTYEIDVTWMPGDAVDLDLFVRA